MKLGFQTHDQTICGNMVHRYHSAFMFSYSYNFPYTPHKSFTNNMYKTNYFCDVGTLSTLPRIKSGEGSARSMLGADHKCWLLRLEEKESKKIKPLCKVTQKESWKSLIHTKNQAVAAALGRCRSKSNFLPSTLLYYTKHT